MASAAEHDARWFLHELWGEKPSDLFILIWKLTGRRSFWFQSVDDAAGAITALTGHDVYMGAGLLVVDHGPTRRGTAGEVAGIAGVWADIDLASAAHSNKPLPATIDEARSILPAEASPTVLISTGNGLHAWWLFKEPWIFEDAPERDEAAALCARWNQLLAGNAAARGWSFDKLSDLARVMRIPGTTNCKAPDNHKAITVVESSGARYEASQLDELLDELGVPVQQMMRTAAPTPTLHGGITVNLDAQISQTQIDGWAELEPRFLATWQRRRRDLTDQSQSGYDMALADFGVDAGLSDQEITDLICYHRRIHGQKSRTRADYYDRTITKARGDRLFTASPSPAQPHAAPPPRTPQDASTPNGGGTQPPAPLMPSLAPPSTPDDDARRAALDIITTYAGVRARRVVKLTGDEPSYRIEFDDVTLHFSDVGKILNQSVVRNALIGATNRMVQKLRTKQWEIVVASMLAALEEEDGGLECNQIGMIRTYLDSYLRDVQFIPSIDDQPSHVVRRPMVIRVLQNVFVRGASLHATVDVISVSAVDLQQHVSRTFEGARASVKAIASMLAALGARSRTVIYHKTKQQGRWLLPPDEFAPADYAVCVEEGTDSER